MANEDVGNWKQVEIGPNESLLMRVLYSHIKNGEVLPVAIRNSGAVDPDYADKEPEPGMSTNWARESSIEHTRQSKRKPAQVYGVVEMNVGVVRNIPSQRVVHTPRKNVPEGEFPNYAHTDVFGPKKDAVGGDVAVGIRTQFRRAFKMVQPPAPSSEDIMKRWNDRRDNPGPIVNPDLDPATFYDAVRRLFVSTLVREIDMDAQRGYVELHSIADIPEYLSTGDKVNKIFAIESCRLFRELPELHQLDLGITLADGTYCRLPIDLATLEAHYGISIGDLRRSGEGDGLDAWRDRFIAIHDNKASRAQFVEQFVRSSP